MLKGIADRSHHWHKHHAKKMIDRTKKTRTASLTSTKVENEHKFRDLVANITPFQKFKWKIQKKLRGMLNYGRAN